MGIQLPESLLTMKFLVIAALCATAMGLPQGRKLRAEEHWRPAQDRDLSKYQPRHPTVAAGTGDVDMDRINKVAAELRGRHFSNHKDKGTPRAECGIEGPQYKGKIVGGEEATPHTWPWQVALFIDNAWFCGGSIISENYVLTAAHCADGASYFDVMAGAHNVREGNEAGRVEITSYNGWTHPQWDSHTLSNDLALIELPSPLPMNSIISSSCLPSAGQIPSVGSMMTITGWGKPSDSAGGISPVLREVRDIPVMSNKDCNDVYGIVGDGVICIDTTGGRGSCNGDSGGPMVQKDGAKGAGQKWIQQGIVSFGASIGCEAGMPAGFTRTEYYLDWINSETGRE